MAIGVTDPTPADSSVVIGGATRPRPGETENGDAWTVQRHNGRVRVSLVDALGHGPEAARASGAALVQLERRPELGPLEALELCHAHLHGTRGAAVAIALVDPAAGALTYAGIGNIEARLVAGGRVERLISYRGIVGSAIRTVRAFERALPSPWLLALHSDGVSGRSELPDPSRDADLDALAAGLLGTWARESDDATVVLARG